MFAWRRVAIARDGVAFITNSGRCSTKAIGIEWSARTLPIYRLPISSVVERGAELSQSAAVAKWLWCELLDAAKRNLLCETYR